MNATRFYVQRPCNEYWKTDKPNYVIEARPVDISKSGLHDWQRTADYAKQYLQVVNPKNYEWPLVSKKEWVECSGPSRKLSHNEYVKLYQSLDSAHPLPKNWTRLRSCL